MLGRYVTRVVDVQEQWSKQLGDFKRRWLSACFGRSGRSKASPTDVARPPGPRAEAS